MTVCLQHRRELAASAQSVAFRQRSGETLYAHRRMAPAMNCASAFAMAFQRCAFPAHGVVAGSVSSMGCIVSGSRPWPNLSLNPDASPAALVRRPLGAG